MSGSVEITQATPQGTQKDAKRKHDEMATAPRRVASKQEATREPSGESSTMGKRMRLEVEQMRNVSPVPSTSGSSWVTGASGVSRGSSAEHRDDKRSAYRKMIFEHQLKCDAADRELGVLMRDWKEKFGEEWQDDEEA